MWRFALGFCGVLGALFVAELTAPVQEHFVTPWTEAVAQASGIVIRWIQPRIEVGGVTLIDPATGFGMTIVAGCNGVEAMLILVAAMLAYPSTIGQKLLGIAIGGLAVQLLNLVRVVSLFFLGHWNAFAFEFAHLYLWQALIMLDVLIVWLVWLRTLPGSTRSHA